MAKSKNEKAQVHPLIGTHLRFCWWSLLCFLTLGIVLEGLHGLKVGWYVDLAHETRRLMWTLAHAHGTLLSLVHAAFAGTIHAVPAAVTGSTTLVSRLLMAASILLPGGFFVAGAFIYGGDPGLGILLVPVGALALLIGVLLVARSIPSDAGA